MKLISMNGMFGIDSTLSGSFLNPNGIQIIQPRVAEALRRLPWVMSQIEINPEGVASSLARWLQPFQGWSFGWRLTQGSPLRGQPWAEGCNPVGIEIMHAREW
jgi:hypothetical protein